MFFITEQEAIGGAAKTDRKVAKHIRNLTDFSGNAALYQMTPPYDGQEFVIASAVNDGRYVHETYLFPATPAGEIADWTEMDGSQRNTTSHDEVMANIGYVIE